jgi:hypothetical protein
MHNNLFGYYMYFKFLLLHVKVFIGIPKLYNMENVDLEFSSTMYSNFMVIDWSSEHFGQLWVVY